MSKFNVGDRVANKVLGGPGTVTRVAVSTHLTERAEDQHPARAGQISEAYRKDPEMRRWDGSYTKTVVNGLCPVLRGDSRVTDAMSLLADYWRTQHEVYKQRDAARQELAATQALLREREEQLVNLQETRRKVEARAKSSENSRLFWKGVAIRYMDRVRETRALVRSWDDEAKG